METENALVQVQTHSVTEGAGFALAKLSDAEFESVMKMAVKGRQRLQQVMRSMMQLNVHYGVIPGTQQTTLLKPGAEVLRQMFRLVAEPKSEIRYGDGVTAPHITVTTKSYIHQESTDGPVVAVGEAAANSWEKKWRYRNADRVCPNCGKPNIIKGKQEFGGGWLCWKKKGGCGSQFRDGDKAIEGQATGQVDNPDPYEQLNTIVKISEKRADVSGTIKALSSSDLFTQDIGDTEELPAQTPQDQQEQARTQEADEQWLLDFCQRLEAADGSCEDADKFNAELRQSAPPNCKEAARKALREISTGRWELEWRNGVAVKKAKVTA